MEEKCTFIDCIKCGLFVIFFSGIESVVDNIFRMLGIQEELMETILNKEQQAIAINLAMNIESGIIKLSTILDEINNDPCGWVHILAFWMRCNDMTRGVIDRLCLEKNYSLSISAKQTNGAKPNDKALTR